MKVKTIIKFKDKNTLTWHEINDVFEVTEERYEEIKKFVEKVDNKKTSEKAGKSQK